MSFVIRIPDARGASAANRHPSSRPLQQTAPLKSTPPHNRQLNVYYYLIKYSVDGFVGELTL